MDRENPRASVEEMLEEISSGRNVPESLTKIGAALKMLDFFEKAGPEGIAKLREELELQKDIFSHQIHPELRDEIESRRGVGWPWRE